MQPTEEAYAELQLAFDHYNRHLFTGSLPACLITLQREKKSAGYFSERRFVNAIGECTDEIALNPAHFAVTPLEDVLQVLVHNMVHLWQHHHGSAGRRGYHNKQWAQMMIKIGLHPSDTGTTDGKMVGEKMAQYPIPGKGFEVATKRLLTTDFRLSWADRLPTKEKLEAVIAGNVEGIDQAELEERGIDLESALAEPKATRSKYTCLGCDKSVWGRPNLNIICADCDAHFAEGA